MAGDVDAEHLASDAAIEAFDHAVGLGGIGPRRAMTDPHLYGGSFKIVSGEARSSVGQNMCDAERDALA